MVSTYLVGTLSLETPTPKIFHKIRGLRAEFYPGIRSRIQNLACLLGCLVAWLLACLSVRQFNIHVLCPFSLYEVFFFLQGDLEVGTTRHITRDTPHYFLILRLRSLVTRLFISFISCTTARSGKFGLLLFLFLFCILFHCYWISGWRGFVGATWETRPVSGGRSQRYCEIVTEDRPIHSFQQRLSSWYQGSLQQIYL